MIKKCDKNDLTSSQTGTSKSVDNKHVKKNIDSIIDIMPYSLTKVNRCLAISQTPGKDTSLDDLKIEVEILTKEIVYLKQNQMISDHRISNIENISQIDIISSSKGKEKIAENSNNQIIRDIDVKNDFFFGYDANCYCP